MFPPVLNPIPHGIFFSGLPQGMGGGIHPHLWKIHLEVSEPNSFFAQSMVHIYGAQIQKDFFPASKLWIWRMFKVQLKIQFAHQHSKITKFIKEIWQPTFQRAAKN